MFREYAEKALPRQGNLFQSKSHMPVILLIWIVCIVNVLSCAAKSRPKVGRLWPMQPIVAQGPPARAEDETSIE